MGLSSCPLALIAERMAAPLGERRIAAEPPGLVSVPKGAITAVSSARLTGVNREA